MKDNEIVEIGSLIYTQWSRCWDNVKRVKAEKDDGSPDWAAFHEARMNNAVAEEFHWNQLKQNYINENRDALNRTYN